MIHRPLHCDKQRCTSVLFAWQHMKDVIVLLTPIYKIKTAWQRHVTAQERFLL